MVFSVNRNPSCGFGTIDWFFATPRRFAKPIFGILDDTCPPDAPEKMKEFCSTDVKRCFGLECFLVFASKRANASLHFLPEATAPLVGHWQGHQREFTCGAAP